MDVFFWGTRTGGFARVMQTVSVTVALLIAIPGQYVFPVLAKLDGGIKETVRNAFLFSVGYVWYSLICLAVTGVCLWLVYTQTGMALVFALFVGFSLQNFVKSFFYYLAMLNHIDEQYDDLDGVMYEEGE